MCGYDYRKLAIDPIRGNTGNNFLDRIKRHPVRQWCAVRHAGSQEDGCFGVAVGKSVLRYGIDKCVGFNCSYDKRFGIYETTRHRFAA